MKKWVIRKWNVAKQNPLFWVNFMLLGIVYSVWHFTPSAHERADLWIRMLGTALELLGVATVWYDLSRTAVSVGREGILRRTWKWLGVLVLNRPVTLNVQSLFHGSYVTAARVRQRHSAPEGADMLERLAVLEKNLAAVDGELAASWSKIDTVATEMKSALTKEREARDEQIKDVNRRLAEVASGSYALLLFGVVWLCVGLVISGFSTELLNLKWF